MSVADYDPRIFNVADLRAAKNIILTPEDGRTTDERWRLETPYLADLILSDPKLNELSIVLDYGCGVGRLARELIARVGCRVIGVDISASMRAIAAAYVDSEKFLACHPDMLPRLGVRCDLAIAVWVLQHVNHPQDDLKRIAGALRPRAPLFVVNEGGDGRVVPSARGWVNDGLELRRVLDQRFELGGEGKLDPAVVTEAVSLRTFWAVYQRRAGSDC